jgi:hypothetical protein
MDFFFSPSRQHLPNEFGFVLTRCAGGRVEHLIGFERDFCPQVEQLDGCVHLCLPALLLLANSVIEVTQEDGGIPARFLRPTLVDFVDGRSRQVSLRRNVGKGITRSTDGFYV